MTDAERIAEYLLSIQWANVTAEDVRAYVTTPRGDADPDSCYEAVTGLMAMLSDVRREEREACAEIAHGLARRAWTPLDEDIVAQVDPDGEPDGFDIAGERIRRAILARG